MLARLRSWRQKTSKTLDAVIIISLVILLALLVMIILGYIFNWPWTGLRGRTLHDWLQLLIIPAVLAICPVYGRCDIRHCSIHCNTIWFCNQKRKNTTLSQPDHHPFALPHRQYCAYN